jgi:uncharacterized protein (TIGR00369 family)
VTGDAVADAFAAARAAGDPAALCRLIPFGARFGLEAALLGGELVGVLRYSAELIGNPALPALHGGAIGALLESTAIIQLIWEADEVVVPKTISLTIDYLRSGRPIDTFARGTVTKQGRRVTNVRVEAWQDERARPIAIGHGHFLIASDR